MPPLQNEAKHLSDSLSSRRPFPPMEWRGYDATWTHRCFFLSWALLAGYRWWSSLEWNSIEQVLIVIVLGLALVVHELVRPYCVNVLDIVVLLSQVSQCLSGTLLAAMLRGWKPLAPDSSILYECYHAVAFCAGSRNGGNLLKAPNTRIFRRNTKICGGFLGWITSKFYKTRIESFYFKGLEHLWVRSTCGPSASTPSLVIMYIHGGGCGLFCPRLYSSIANRMQALLQDTLASMNLSSHRVDILLADYRKIPEHSFSACAEDVADLFENLVEKQSLSPSQIVLAGDSAGAALVLSVLQRRRDAQKPSPLAAVVFGPFADIFAVPKEDNDSCFLTCAMLHSVRSWFETQHPKCSHERQELLALVASAQSDLRGLPPLMIQTGSHDLIHHQALALAKKARADGVPVTLNLYESMPHVFQIFPASMLPRSNDALNDMIQFILQAGLTKPISRAA